MRTLSSGDRRKDSDDVALAEAPVLQRELLVDSDAHLTAMRAQGSQRLILIDIANAGSLRQALSNAASNGGGMIKFDNVGGVIDLSQSTILRIPSNVTIAGETARTDTVPPGATWCHQVLRFTDSKQKSTTPIT